MNFLKNLLAKIPGWSKLPAALQTAIVALLIALAGYLIRYWTGQDVQLVEVLKYVEVEKHVAAPQHNGSTHRQGWVAPTIEERSAALALIKANQGGLDPDFSKLAQAAIAAADNDDPVFMWEAELKVLKRLLPVWNQGSIGSCVSHGVGRADQDCILSQIASGSREAWPGAEVCREAIYGGSRVEIGGGRIRGDGSINAWAVAWLQKYGTLFYKAYPGYDLTDGYSVSRCRQWGDRGCPDELEPIAREHPTLTAAMVKSSGDVWTALGNGYPVCIASNIGFDSPQREGFCARRGSWAHSMCVRGRFIHPSKGRCFVIQNSWGDYLSGGDPYIQVQGRADKVQLPSGCFAVTAADMDAVVRQGDSFALSGFKGFPRRRVDWSVSAPMPHRPIQAIVAAVQLALAA